MDKDLQKAIWAVPAIVPKNPAISTAFMNLSDGIIP